MEMYAVVKKLLGPIETIGETRADDARYENLKETITLVSKLLFDIWQVSCDKTRQEYSVARSGKRADEFIKEVNEAYGKTESQ